MDPTEPRASARPERRAPRRAVLALLASLAAALSGSAACDRRAPPGPACSGGGACTPAEPCRVGTFECSPSGQLACVASGPVADGTACGPDLVCRAGACLACATGAACEPTAGPCHAGTVACGTGAPVCVDAGGRPDGTSCGAGQECRAGACQPFTCTSCHGGQDGDTAGAPPRALAAAVANPLAIGAHRAHLGRDVRCEECHQVPAGVDAPGHLSRPDGSPDGDGVAEVPFPPGSRARLADAAPAWDRTTATCSGVYCHGATGAAPPPPASWLGGATTCASCHASPPPSHGAPGSLALTDCAGCHPATVNADGSIRAGGGHVNGAVEFDAAAACTACHGDRLRPEPDPLLKAAPPAPAAGSPNPGAVGAHAAHLREGPLSQPFSCSSCHQVPARLDHFEAGTRAEIAWDTSADPARNLATRGGATPAWDAASGSCSGVYCHGATLGGGANATPAWTGGAAEVGIGQATLAGRCGACHRAPPAAPHPVADKAGAPIAQATQCADCHPGTVDRASGEINVAGGLHVNGRLDLDFHPAGFAQPASHGPAALRGLGACAACHGPTFDGDIGPSCTACHAAAGHPTWRSECTFCHGSAARAPQGGFALAGLPPVPLDQAAPPVGTQGEQTASQVAVGAHLAHLGATGLARPVQCVECHGAMPTDSAGHADGSVALAWGALATGGGTVAPTPAAGAATPAWEETPTCTNACHGAALPGGSNTAPSWTGGPTQAACGACHAVPLPSTAATGWHVQDPDCGRCHPGSTASTVDAATHVDGAATVVALGCDTCHAAGAPFRATTGATGAADARVGAHDRHLATAIATPLGCADCHLVPGALRHADGSVALAWGPRAAALGAVPAPPAGPILPGQPVTCANYCHGATLFPLGTDRTPSWTGALTGCGTCHTPVGAREHRNGLHNLFPCARCHFSVMSAASDTTIANPALHVNGTGDVQLDPAVLGPSGRFTKVGDTWTCTNLCHQDPTIPPNTHSSNVW